MMKKYIARFNSHSDYEAFTASTEFVTPNVSYCVQEDELHYNPKVEPTTFKYKFTLSDSTVVDGECNSTSAITQAETSPFIGDLVAAEIGQCVISIGSSAFDWCITLTSVTIPNNVVLIEDHAFNYCTGLTSITIPDSVTSIDIYSFADCESLTSVTINATTPPVLGEAAFDNTNNCPIYVPCESVNAYKNAGGYWSTYASRIMCKPDSITYTASEKLNVNLSFFMPAATAETFAAGVGTFEFSEPVTSIEYFAFNGKTAMTSISIPDSVTAIGESAFEDCSGLTSVTIGTGVTSISRQAFYRCSSLTSVTLPNSVTTIGNNAFADCTTLASITVNRATPPTLASTAFNNTNNCPIYVPAESVSTYKSASGWSTYATRIQAMS